MSVERLRRVSTLFDAALEHEESARAAFLARECGDDAELHAELVRLLEREKALEGTSTRSAVGLFARGLEAAATDDARSHAFGPYRLEEEIGSGGMGRVFRARRVDGVVEQEVAIKLVRRELLHPALLRRFSTERQVLAALDHPGISRLVDAGETGDGTPYVVMELVRGEPLLEYCDRRRLSVAQRLELFRRILDAVAHAHRNLVVHRDLKPGNVLVTEEGQPKLLDFGIAKPLAAGGDATATAERFFTPAYAAPEQLRGGPTTVGCDVYALGALLFELLTGRPPFLTEASTPGEIERMITSVPPPAMSGTIGTGDQSRAHQRAVRDTRQLRRQLAGDLEAIVQRALRKEPAARYATVEQFDADLQAFLEDRPVSASGVQFGYRLRKFVARHRLPVGLAAVAAIAVIGGAVLLALQNVALVHERDSARYAADMLKHAFAAADPARETGGDVSAKLILENARSSLEDLRGARPLLYAQLGESIADVQYAIGLWPQSAEQAAKALAAAIDAGADADLRYRLLVLEAAALDNANRLDDAQARLDQAATLFAEPRPAWLLAQGRVLSRSGKGAEALVLLLEAYDELKTRPPTDELANRARWQIAEVHRLRKHYDLALAMFDETLAWQRGVLAPGHPRVLLTQSRRITILRSLERFDEALQEAGTIADAVEAAYGPETPFTAFARNAYGNLLDDRKRVAEASVQYRAALRAWRATLGPTHTNTLRTAFNLALTLGDFDASAAEAEAIFRDVLAEALKRLGPEHNTTRVFRMGYADFLIARKRGAEALGLLLEPEGAGTVRIASAAQQELYRKRLAASVHAAGCPQGTPEPSVPHCADAFRLINSLSP
jgi:serine/threonine protein kinase